MANVLVLAYQTVTSKELIEGLQSFSQKHPGTNFVLVIPATPIEDLLDAPYGATDRVAIAEAAAEAGTQALLSAGVEVVNTVVGDSAPLVAIGDELRRGQYNYDGIIVSTFPTTISHWLRQDLPAQAERRYGLPVTHIIAEREVMPIGADVMD